jgi:hypothetical protein
MTTTAAVMRMDCVRDIASRPYRRLPSRSERDTWRPIRNASTSQKGQDLRDKDPKAAALFIKALLAQHAEIAKEFGLA